MPEIVLTPDRMPNPDCAAEAESCAADRRGPSCLKTVTADGNTWECSRSRGLDGVHVAYGWFSGLIRARWGWEG